MQNNRSLNFALVRHSARAGFKRKAWGECVNGEWDWRFRKLTFPRPRTNYLKRRFQLQRCLALLPT